jgi:hypothetical protein
MAGTQTKSKDTSGHAGSSERDLLLQHQKVVDDLETLRSNPDLIARNRCMANAAIAQGTTAQKVKTVNSIAYAINGALFTKAGTDDFWTLSGTVVAVSSWQKYLLCIDNAGAASIVECTQSLVSAAAVALAALPANKSVVGVLTIATDGTHTFTPGTTALNGTGITATFTNGLDSGYFSAGATALTAAKIGNAVTGNVIV